MISCPLTGHVPDNAQYGRQISYRKGVGHGGNHSAGPVEVIRGYFARWVLEEVIWCCLDIGIERHHHVESIGSKGQPLNGFDVIRTIVVNLNQRHKVIAVDTDGTVSPAYCFPPVSGIRGRMVFPGSGRRDIFHIFNGDFPFRNHAPWNIVEYGVKSAAGPSQRHVCGFRQRPIYHARGVL